MGLGSENKNKTTFFWRQDIYLTLLLDSPSLHLTGVAGAARTAAAALSSTALLDSPRSAAKVTPLFFFFFFF